MTKNLPGALFRGPNLDASGNPISDWKWLLENSTARIEEGSATNTTTAIHTVNEGKTFYIMFAQLAGWNNGAISGGNTLGNLDIGADSLLNISTGESDNAHDALSVSFPTPYPIVATPTTGDIDINLISNRGNFTVRGSIGGFEIDNGTA